MGNVAGSDDDDVVWRKPMLKAIAQGFAIKIPDGFRGAQNRAAQRMIGPKAASEKFVEQVFGIIQIHLDLFEHHLPLFFHVVGVELRAQHEVGENIESNGEVFVEHFGVQADLLFRSKSVQHAADGIHFASDVFGGAAVGSFENHVLQEMGQAVFGENFAAGTIANPNPTETERTCCMVSVITIKPLGRAWRWISRALETMKVL